MATGLQATSKLRSLAPEYTVNAVLGYMAYGPPSHVKCIDSVTIGISSVADMDLVVIDIEFRFGQIVCDSRWIRIDIYGAQSDIRYGRCVSESDGRQLALLIQSSCLPHPIPLYPPSTEWSEAE